MVAEARGLEAKAMAKEKEGLVDAKVLEENMNAEAKGIENKAEAMKKLDGVGKEHEEFKLRLNKDTEIELAGINIQKDIDKVVHNWEEEGIRVEKARWGRHNILKGKIKIELDKSVDASKLTLEKVKSIIEDKAPKKKASKKKTVAKKK